VGSSPIASTKVPDENVRLRAEIPQDDSSPRNPRAISGPLAVSLHPHEPTDVRRPSRRRRHADHRGTGERTCEGRSPDRISGAAATAVTASLRQFSGSSGNPTSDRSISVRRSNSSSSGLGSALACSRRFGCGCSRVSMTSSRSGASSAFVMGPSNLVQALTRSEALIHSFVDGRNRRYQKTRLGPLGSAPRPRVGLLVAGHHQDDRPTLGHALQTGFNVRGYPNQPL
jgi:hypothetical protein